MWENRKNIKLKATQVPAKRGALCMKFTTTTLLQEETPDTTLYKTPTKCLVMTPFGIPSTPPKPLIPNSLIAWREIIGVLNAKRCLSLKRCGIFLSKTDTVTEILNAILYERMCTKTANQGTVEELMNALQNLDDPGRGESSLTPRNIWARFLFHFF